MPKFIIFEKPDKSVAVTHILDETIDEKVHISSLLKDKNHEGYVYKYTTDEFPRMHPDFFLCYVISGNNVALDMAKARDAWKQQLRIKRQPVLANLDVEFQRALEAGDEDLQAAIVAKKNILRDCTENPAIDSAKTIAELRETLPDLLKE